jgi:Flp pilus assembly protein TadD
LRTLVRCALARVYFLLNYILVCFAIICASGCKGVKEEGYRIVLEEGASLLAITALAWPDADSSVGCFAFAADDGFIRVVDVFSGKPLAVFSAGEEKISSLVFNSGTELLLLSERGKSVTYSLLESLGNALGKPAGGEKTFSLVDGAVCLSDSAKGKEIARYYFFSKPDEWVCLTPEGFYNASNKGAALIALEAGKRRYRLDSFSSALYRPDLVAALLLIEKETISELPFTLPDLFKEDRMPPLVSLSFDESSSELRIKIAEQKGGAGYVALYHRAGEAEFPLEIPAGFFNVKNEAVKKFSENGRPCYEINMNIDYSVQGEIGVSAFNGSFTVESERSWLKLPSTRVLSVAAEAPVLRALVATGSGERESAEELAELFSLQSEGDLYSNVEVVNLIGEDFSKAGFISAGARLGAMTKKDDVLVVYLRGTGYADTFGNLGIVPEKPGENENLITGEEILASLLSFSSNSLFLLLDLNSDLPSVKMEAALQRFVARFGPRALTASFGSSGNGSSLFGFLAEGFKPGFADVMSDKKYLYAEELLAYVAANAKKTEGQGSLVFFPMEDFRIIDPFINSSELMIQAMSSGMLRIDQVDKTPVPLAFGDTMIRVLPAGSYIIDLTYRNGYKETRTVELRRKESRWVIFNYTVPYLAGNFSALYSGRLPQGGINVSELNPANYQKVDREAMEGMGMAPYYVAFLGGEKFYRDGEYDKAIAEYSRCISLKADYAEAYASRGNAYRKKGDVSRAIEDYSRAIRLKSTFAEVYNYRGFLYAQGGDYRRAIEDYTQAIRYKGDYADAYFNRAHAHGELGNWDLSIADYTQVIKLEPRNWAAYNQRGKAWDNKGDRVKADEDYRMSERLK